MTYRIQDLIDWDVTNVQAVREPLDRAAAAVIPTDPDKWASWVVYMLEALDCNGGAAGRGVEFQDVLSTVKTAIATRQYLGRW
jgi:hypothetical protein